MEGNQYRRQMGVTPQILYYQCWVAHDRVGATPVYHVTTETGLKSVSTFMHCICTNFGGRNVALGH